MKKSASSLALAALCCFGGTLHAAAPAGGGSRLYCCQDSSGKQVCGDILPQVCYGRAYREIGADGRTVREVDAPLTAEQRAQKVAEEAKRKEEEARQKEQQRKDQALMDTFITPAQKHQRRLGDKGQHPLVIQRTPLRRQVDHTTGGPHGSGLPGLCRHDGFLQRAGQHDHPGATAIGPIIDGAMPILGEIPRVPAIQLVETTLQRPARDAEAREGGEHLGKQGDDIVGLATFRDTHQSASHSTRMVPASMSTAVT